MVSKIPEIVYAFAPQLNAFMSAGIFVVSCRSLIILGNPGATSRDDAIFAGESLL